MDSVIQDISFSLVYGRNSASTFRNMDVEVHKHGSACELVITVNGDLRWDSVLTVFFFVLTPSVMPSNILP